MKKIRITAICKTCYPDLMAKYENPIGHACNDGFRPVSFYIEALDENAE